MRTAIPATSDMVNTGPTTADVHMSPYRSGVRTGAYGTVRAAHRYEDGKATRAAVPGPGRVYTPAAVGSRRAGCTGAGKAGLSAVFSKAAFTPGAGTAPTGAGRER